MKARKKICVGKTVGTSESKALVSEVSSEEELLKPCTSKALFDEAKSEEELLRHEYQILQERLEQGEKDNRRLKEIASEFLPGDWLDEYLKAKLDKSTKDKPFIRVIDATILFVRLKGYVRHCCELSTDGVYELANKFHMAVDGIASKYNLRKLANYAGDYIQLIGNTVIAGTHQGTVIDVVDAACDIIIWLNGNSPVSGTVGISTGEVAIGVIGNSIGLQVFGDVVVTAALLQKTSKVGKISCDLATKEAVTSYQGDIGGDFTKFQFDLIPNEDNPDLKGKRKRRPVTRYEVTRP